MIICCLDSIACCLQGFVMLLLHSLLVLIEHGRVLTRLYLSIIVVGCCLLVCLVVRLRLWCCSILVGEELIPCVILCFLGNVYRGLGGEVSLILGSFLLHRSLGRLQRRGCLQGRGRGLLIGSGLRRGQGFDLRDQLRAVRGSRGEDFILDRDVCLSRRDNTLRVRSRVH